MAAAKNTSLSLGPNESVRSAVKRVTGRRVDCVVELLNRSSNADPTQRIHEARKQLKQLRALLRLVEHEIGRHGRVRADKCLRVANRALARLRDTTVLLASLRQLRRNRQISPTAHASARTALETRLHRTYTQVLGAPRHRRHLTKPLLDARRQVDRWSSIHRGWKAVGPGLRQTYRAARTAAKLTSDSSDKSLHEARKRAKDLLYTMEFLQPVQPQLMRAMIRTARRLTDCLGDDHDLAVLERALRTGLQRHLSAIELRRLTTIIARRRRLMQMQARGLARSLYAPTEDAFANRIHAHWKKWRRYPET